MFAEPVSRRDESGSRWVASLEALRATASDHSDSLWHQVARGVGLILLSLAILWCYVATTETLMLPRGDSTSLDYLEAEAPQGAPLPSADRHGYGVNVFTPGSAGFTLSGDIRDDVREYESPAILIPRARRTIRASLNGVELASETRVSQLYNYATFRPQLFRIPPEVMETVRKTGTANLELRASSVLTQPYVAMPVLGELDKLVPAARWRVRIGYDLAMLASAVCIVITLVGLVMGFDGRRRYQWWSFAIVMFCWAAINLYYVGVFSPIDPVVGQVVMAAANYLLIIASLAFINEWTLKIGWVRKWLIPFLLFVAVAKSLPVVLTGGAAMGWVRIALEVVAAVAVIAMIVMLSVGFARRKTASSPAALVFLVSLFAVSFDILTAAIPDTGLFIWPRTGQTVHAGTPMSLLLGLTLIGAFARGYIESQTVLSTANQRLSEELDAREDEIRAVYRARATEMREAALVQERKRIMRDMHDGIGGDLLSLSLRARGGDLPNDTIAKELSNSLQQLRLVVDSLDTAGDDLDIALGALRGRIEPALAAAGMTLHWKIGDLGRDARYGPQQVLDVYRIIQEATTNAIRHSEGSKLSISTTRHGDTVKIVIEDDGCGVPPDAHHGKGLESLKARTHRLGGTLSIVAEPDGGTALHFSLPFQPPRNA